MRTRSPGSAAFTAAWIVGYSRGTSRAVHLSLPQPASSVAASSTTPTRGIVKRGRLGIKRRYRTACLPPHPIVCGFGQAGTAERMLRLDASALDYAILAVYFLVVLGIGGVARLSIK